MPRKLTAHEIKALIGHYFGDEKTTDVRNDHEVSINMGAVPLCDFCSEKANPDIIYQATGDSYMGELPGGWEAWSDDRWGACDPCAALIDAGDKEGLVRRSAQTFFKKHSLPTTLYGMMERDIRRAHNAFWSTKKP